MRKAATNPIATPIPMPTQLMLFKRFERLGFAGEYLLPDYTSVNRTLQSY
jgi:hypothetical protein